MHGTKTTKRLLKAFNAPVEFKLGDEPGSFRATFSLFNVKDLDGDVTLPGAFQVGAPVRLAQFGHNWSMPPIGVGTIGADETHAWVDGQFNLAMTAGKDTYESVKALGPQQQWSYGYDLDEWSVGDFGGEKVRLIRAATVHEVSPVMLGAQPLTSTDRIKAAKVGRRHSAADESALRDALAALEGASVAMRALLGDDEDNDAGSGSEDGKASKGERPKAEARTRETTAARIALELASLSD